MIYASIFSFAAFCLLLWYLRLDTYKRAKEKTEKESADDMLYDINLVKNARDRLNAVDSSAAKLRQKYLRKE